MEVNANNFLNISFILTFVKVAILIILFFYAIFSLIIVRQVDLMSKTLITNVSKFLTPFAIIHAGFAVGLILLVWGVL